MTTSHGERDQALRLPAAELDRIIKTRIYQLLADSAALFNLLRESDMDEKLFPPLSQRAASLVAQWDNLPGPRIGMILRTFISRIEVHDRYLIINLVPEHVVHFLQSGDSVSTDQPSFLPTSKTKNALQIPLRVETDIFHNRRGRQMIVNGITREAPDEALVSLIVQAQALKNKWLDGHLDIKKLARTEDLNASWITRVMRLAFLAPDITEAILKGRQPAKLCAHHLVTQSVNLPLDWSDQRAFLGFSSRNA